MDDVAASAGTSRALVYHYFGSKQELYLPAQRRAAQQLTALIDPGGDGSPADRLAGAPSRYFGYVEDHAAGYVALMGGHTGVAGPMGPAGKIGKIIEGVRQVVLESILKALGVAVPDPVLRVTLRCWLACAEAAGLDWLAKPRSAAGHAGAHADRAIGRATTGRGDARRPDHGVARTTARRRATASRMNCDDRLGRHFSRIDPGSVCWEPHQSGSPRRYPPYAAQRPPGPTPPLKCISRRPGRTRDRAWPGDPPRRDVGSGNVTPTAAAGYPQATREPRSPGSGGDPRACEWRSACQPWPTA